jgi:CheY-like chemotaxis protein
MSGSKLILVADDYDDAARYLAEILGWATHFDTMYTKDGVKALEMTEQRRPDAAILDIDMPRINGLEAARLFRERYAERRPLLIAVTGRESATEVELSGLFDYVEKKPVEVVDLMRILQSI